MKKISLLFFFLSQLILAQNYSTSLEIKYNWNGWDVVSIKNGLISTVIVPDIGARVMEYNLDGYASIYRDSSLNGKTYIPTADSPFRNFGGFKNWPSPQYGPGRWSWPPPPILDCGKYNYEILADTPDSATIKVISPIEQWKAPNLQFVRRMTIYKNSSRVKMEQFLLNTGDTLVNWGIWDITQSIVNHRGVNDFGNFWVYFPINPNSVFGSDGVKFDQSSAGWTGEAAPGIYGCRFTPDSQKLFADPNKGWICYVDELNGVAFTRTFPVFEGAGYPDDGARVAVYMDAKYMEVEVTGPVEDIPAGGMISFTEDWYAAKVNGPILSVNSAGAINSFLKLDKNVITGNYGVFYIGKAKLVYLNYSGQKIGEGTEHSVSPLENFDLSESVTLPESTEKVRLNFYDENGNLVHVLDELELNPTGIADSKEIHIKDFKLKQNYPNPFNPGTVILYQVPVLSHVTLKVYDLLGKEITTLVDEEKPAGSYSVKLTINNIQLTSGIYFYRMQAGSFSETKKLLLLK
ncbi:MAG: T9SS type A sorting domain-containing protein [Ignavibacteriaceae bacterium]